MWEATTKLKHHQFQIWDKLGQPWKWVVALLATEKKKKKKKKRQATFSGINFKHILKFRKNAINNGMLSLHLKKKKKKKKKKKN